MVKSPPVQIPRQRLIVLSVTPVTSVKGAGDNERKPGTVHGFPRHLPYGSRKPQPRDRLKAVQTLNGSNEVYYFQMRSERSQSTALGEKEGRKGIYVNGQMYLSTFFFRDSFSWSHGVINCLFYYLFAFFLDKKIKTSS